MLPRPCRREPASRGSRQSRSGRTRIFVNVGERTNVTGSRAFAKRILAGDYEAAVAIARSQVENGAQLIDVNMDEGLLDAEAAMTRFLDMIAGEPAIARVPVMIDSSKWSVIEAGLRCVQGRPVVNSLSLKEGEAPFLAQARLARRYGAAVVVMAFDEAGQADSVERRVEILARAHRILVEQAGFDDEDIIHDPNVFAVGTGIEEHANYGVAYIEAVTALRRRFPVSLERRDQQRLLLVQGNDPVREAIHACFFYHAIRAVGIGIVNPAALAIYDEIDPELRSRRGPGAQPAPGRDRAAAGDRRYRAGRPPGDRTGSGVAVVAGHGAPPACPHRGDHGIRPRRRRGGPAGGGSAARLSRAR